MTIDVGSAIAKVVEVFDRRLAESETGKKELTERASAACELARELVETIERIARDLLTAWSALDPVKDGAEAVRALVKETQGFLDSEVLIGKLTFVHGTIRGYTVAMGPKSPSGRSFRELDDALDAYESHLRRSRDLSRESAEYDVSSTPVPFDRILKLARDALRHDPPALETLAGQLEKEVEEARKGTGHRVRDAVLEKAGITSVLAAAAGLKLPRPDQQLVDCLPWT